MNKIENLKPIIRTSLTQVIGKNQMQQASVTRDKLIQAITLLNQIVELITSKSKVSEAPSQVAKPSGSKSAPKDKA